MKHIANLTYELCETEVPGMKYDSEIGGIQKYYQHQRYWIDVLKEDMECLYDRMGLWIEIRKWLKELKLESTIDVSPFTEEDLQRAGMKADRLSKMPSVEGARHALSELLREWSGTSIVSIRVGKNGDNKKMLQLKPKYEVEEIPKAPANSIVLMDGRIVYPEADMSCVWLMPPMGMASIWAEHHMRKRHEYSEEFQEFFDGLLDKFMDVFALRKPEMFRAFLDKLTKNKPASYAKYFPCE